MGSKKKGLPFIVQPRLKPIVEVIGSDLSGKIKIERKGYLTVAEKSIVQGGMQDDDGTRSTINIAGKIAKAEGISIDQVFEDFTSGDRPDYLEKHQDLLAEMLVAMTNHENRLRLVACTALLMTRVNPEWDPAQTSELHPDLQEALFNLYKDEEKKSIDALEEAVVAQDKAVKRSESGKK